MGRTIKLDAPIDEIRARIGDDMNRPIFKKLSQQAFNELKEKRDAIYTKFCDVIIDTSQKKPSRNCSRN